MILERAKTNSSLITSYKGCVGLYTRKFQIFNIFGGSHSRYTQTFFRQRRCLYPKNIFLQKSQNWRENPSRTVSAFQHTLQIPWSRPRSLHVNTPPPPITCRAWKVRSIFSCPATNNYLRRNNYLFVRWQRWTGLPKLTTSQLSTGHPEPSTRQRGEVAWVAEEGGRGGLKRRREAGGVTREGARRRVLCLIYANISGSASGALLWSAHQVTAAYSINELFSSNPPPTLPLNASSWSVDIRRKKNINKSDFQSFKMNQHKFSSTCMKLWGCLPKFH